MGAGEEAALAAALGSWAVVAGAIAVRRRRNAASGGEARVSADPVSRVGMLLQGAALVALALLARPWRAPLVPEPAAELGLMVLAVLLCALGAWLALASIRTLGQNWSLTARTREDHQLVTRGPYGWVRHPIYLAIFLLGLGTALAVARPEAVPLAAGVYLLGTAVRVRSEERLLRAAFGPVFEAYARRVPALLPWPRRSG